MLEKNSIRDPVMAVKAIAMSYLEYLDFVSDRDEKGNLVPDAPLRWFVGLLALVLDKKEDENFTIVYGSDKNGKPFFKIGDDIYNSSDFDELRKIISEQNALELPDEKIQKEVRDSMEEARRFKERLNKSKTASFEEQLTALSLYSGWDLDKIYNMTIRKFNMAIQRANHMIMSNIYLTASMSGFTTFKDKSILRGWLADLTSEDKYADVTVGLDSITKKVSGEEAKENTN